MAAEVLLKFIEGIASELGSLTVPYIHIMFCLEGEKRKFLLKLSAFKEILLEGGSRQGSHTTRDEVWLEMLRDVLYDAEDLVDELSTEAFRLQSEVRNNLVDKILNFFSAIPFYCTVAFRMKLIRDRLNDLAADKSLFLGMQPVISFSTENKGKEDTYSYVPSTEIVGREAEKREIIEQLVDSSSQEDVSIIPIVGIGGLGKTALAQLVYNDEQIKRHFELRMWASISDNFDLKIVVKKIFESALDREPANLSMNTLQNHLRKAIDGKRYLLVLDNVWNKDYREWSKLKHLLMGGRRGSKIIVTTRTGLVAIITGTVSPIVLEGLSESDSWSLFTKMAFEQGQEPRNSTLLAIAEEIVKNCAGVPLVIRTMGSLLRFRNSAESDWLRFKNNNALQIDEPENDILPILKLSYDQLPAHLKPCFAYCSLFPKGYEIDKDTLINLWMAQEFVQPSGHENYQCPEDIGHRYFMDLLLGSFFQEVKTDEWGNVVGCKMHDLMHDLAKSVVGRDCLSNSEVKNLDEKTHHISIDFNFIPAQEVFIPLLKVKQIRTLLFPVQQPHLAEGSSTESICDAIFSNFRRLRVLDMHCLELKFVSSSIGELKHLRYLDLSGNTTIKILPDTITRLQNLQTLKLNNCSKLKELPRDIEKLRRLRHLQINKTSLNHMPRGLGKLISLRTLTQFVVGKDRPAIMPIKKLRRTPGMVDRRVPASRPTGALDELKGLSNLRGELMIKNLRNVGKSATSESHAAKLIEKQNLQSLMLQWGQRQNVDRGTIDGDLELLGGLQPHPNLKNLSIHGYGGVSCPSWMDNMNLSLPNLTRITMSECKLVSRCLPRLSHLPSLKFLHLYNFPALQYIEVEFAESASNSPFFPSLEELKLVTLIYLKGWWRHEHQHMLRPSFPRLSKLHIRNCPNLTSFPQFPCIEEIDMKEVSEELQQLTMVKPKAAESSRDGN